MEENGPRAIRSEKAASHFQRSLELASQAFRLILFVVLLSGASAGFVRGQSDTLSKIQQSHQLTYGADMEGGGPFIYPDAENPGRLKGFEVELMDALAAELGAKARMSQGQWDTLLEVLYTKRVDMVVNGYELTPERSERFLASRPYYIYQLQLMSRKGASPRSWSEVEEKTSKPWRIGVLRGSVAEPFARNCKNKSIQVVGFDGAADAMEAVANGQIDATLQDLPAAQFYIGRQTRLELAGPPVGGGFYVVYMRREDSGLKLRVDQAIEKLLEDGTLKAIYERYSIWTERQNELETWTPETAATSTAQAGGWLVVWRNAPLLLRAAALTVFLSVTSMPLAMAIGLCVALGRMYGPAVVRGVLRTYVEVIRGTPLMLQLYVIFFLLPRIGLTLDPIVAGIAGLAINYSAYEAEIYRAGLQAIPIGQMEAALALGMTRATAIRKVIVPQAVRIVIPPVTNDFIALFKDTSVCSVITLEELTKEYNILALSTGKILEFGITAAILYMAMSLPLSWFSGWFEKRLSGESRTEGVRA